jgi:hypothetical protein
MPPIATDRLGRSVALLLLALTACTGQVLAAVCDQPVVHFQAGQLTLSSNGCSLQQVLTAVGRKTGIETKLPPSTGTIPVFANLGPGDPRQVVSALLDGIPFNWSLAIADGGSRSLVGVVLTEQVPEAVQAALARAAVATESGKLQANRALSGGTAANRKGNDAIIAASLEEQPDQPRKRADIDKSVLDKLPPLPPGVPSSMWQLYPDVVGNILANGGTAPTTAASPNGQLTSSLTPPGASVTRGCQNCPVPPGVDPRIVNLYPSNLLQLIQTPITQPTLQLPPPAPFPPAH